jgi:hypothetical protein
VPEVVVLVVVVLDTVTASVEVPTSSVVPSVEVAISSVVEAIVSSTVETARFLYQIMPPTMRMMTIAATM